MAGLELLAFAPAFPALAWWGWAAWTGRLSPGPVVLPPLRLPEPPPPPPEPWTREDARRAAELYRQVPEAFWLAPEYTRYDGPDPEPIHRHPIARPALTPIRSSRNLPHVLHGRQVQSFVRDEVRQGWKFKLERKPTDVSDPWVFMPDSHLEHWRLRH